MMVNNDGHVIVVVETCSAVVVSVSLTRENGAELDVVWDNDDVSQGHDQVESYDTGIAVADLAPGSYTASADTDDIDAAVHHTRARRADLARLRPTEVLWLNDPSSDGEPGEPKVSNAEDFAEHAFC